MKDESKKGALVALVAGAPRLSEDEDSGSMPEPGDASFRAVAKAFGIPPERQASAQAALHQYIKSCLSSAEPDADDEEY